MDFPIVDSFLDRRPYSTYFLVCWPMYGPYDQDILSNMNCTVHIFWYVDLYGLYGPYYVCDMGSIWVVRPYNIEYG